MSRQECRMFQTHPSEHEEASSQVCTRVRLHMHAFICIYRAGHDTQKMYNRYNYNYTLFSYNRYYNNYFKKNHSRYNYKYIIFLVDTS